MKEKINYLIICEDSQNLGKSISFLGPIVKLIVPFLPTQQSFSICAGVSDVETEKDYPLRLALQSPSGELLFEEVATANPPPELMLNEGPATITFSLNIRNIVIPEEEGEYKLTLSFGEAIAEQTFYIYKNKKR